MLKIPRQMKSKTFLFASAVLAGFVLPVAAAKALNQTGRDGRVKYVRADDVSWNADKDRRSVDEARLEVLHALVRLKEGGI